MALLTVQWLGCAPPVATMPRDTAKVNSPWPKTNAGYLKKKRNSASNMNAPILLEAAQ